MNYMRKELKRRVELSDFSMKGLSKAVGHGETLVRDIITGRTKTPSLHVMELLAEKLACSLEELYGPDYPRSEEKPEPALAGSAAYNANDNRFANQHAAAQQHGYGAATALMEPRVKPAQSGGHNPFQPSVNPVSAQTLPQHHGSPYGAPATATPSPAYSPNGGYAAATAAPAPAASISVREPESTKVEFAKVETQKVETPREIYRDVFASKAPEVPAGLPAFSTATLSSPSATTSSTPATSGLLSSGLASAAKNEPAKNEPAKNEATISRPVAVSVKSSMPKQEHISQIAPVTYVAAAPKPGFFSKIAPFVSFLMVMAGVYLVIIGYDPARGAGVYQGISYPSKGVSFDPVRTALGCGILFAAFAIYNGRIRRQ